MIFRARMPLPPHLSIGSPDRAIVPAPGSDSQGPYNLPVPDRAPDDTHGPERAADEAAMTKPAGSGGVAGPCGQHGTQLIASRSLGRLLGLESMLFKVECWQPTGTWLDRSAVALVAAAVAEGRTGLCA